MCYFAVHVKKADIIQQIRSKKSYLCTGLDTEIGKLPHHLPKNGSGMLTFNREIIDSTSNYSVAYKINTAFYEQYGVEGWEIMNETLNALPQETFKIADAKRGDIGNTSTMYARAFFDAMKFDAITVSPYMGEDSLRPFLEFKDKFVICLALTSNDGHKDFQLSQVEEDKKLYEHVIEQVSKWGNPDNLMFVVGATRAEAVKHIRTLIPETFLLVPGVGAQGGSLSDITHASANSDLGLLVNSSRGIIYADSTESFAETAGSKAKELALEMSTFVEQYLV